MTSREVALIICGEDDVRAYERVKTVYTLYGNVLEASFALAVGGRVGGRGEPDVITDLGEFEFCAEANTKNSAGDAAQRARGATVVQVSGKLRPGRISATEFLRQHGIKNAERVASECQISASNQVKARILELFQ